jgi:hypothetical protein
MGRAQPQLTGGPQGTRRADITGRFPVEPNWPAGGTSSHRRLDWQYDVDTSTGYAYNTWSQGQWARGELVRVSQPAFGLGPFWPMFDPTQPAEYHNLGGP